MFAWHYTHGFEPCFRAWQIAASLFKADARWIWLKQIFLYSTRKLARSSPEIFERILTHLLFKLSLFKPHILMIVGRWKLGMLVNHDSCEAKSGTRYISTSCTYLININVYTTISKSTWGVLDLGHFSSILSVVYIMNSASPLRGNLFA